MKYILIPLFVLLSLAIHAQVTPAQFKQYQSEAINGSPTSQYNLGQCYYFGWGVAKNHQEAVKW